MALDTLLWGNSRPRIRVGSAAQTNGTNYVFNQPPASVPDEYFTKHIILNESALTIYLNEHIIKRRGIFTFDYELIDKPSCERLIDILNSSSNKFLRPHFNFYKEYKIRCVNEWELDNLKKSNQPYQGILQFETIEGESSIPSESSGSFNFNGSTKVADASLASAISGDCSVEMWIKTPSSFSSKEELFSMASAAVTWTVSINTDGTIEFVTDDGSTHTLTSGADQPLSVSTWHFLQIRRVNTDDKYIVVDGVELTDGSDLKAANNITGVQLGETSNGFSGLCQIFRVYAADVSDTLYSQHSIEAIGTTQLSYLKVWWDFSQGSATDLTAGGNNGTVTGTSQYYEESFPDNGEEYMT